MGFGAMRLTGLGVWGPPADQPKARAVLRRAIELGVQFVDTADVYGPGDNERLIREALHPYPADVVIATKGGLVRSGPATREDPGMSMNGTEAHIRGALERSLSLLGVGCVDLYQLHRVDPATPIEETMRVFRDLRNEGKLRHVGLSEVSVEQIERARSIVEVATVQNAYNLASRQHGDVLAYCERNAIGFIPFYPLSGGALVQSSVIAGIATKSHATPSQVALAWLLAKSPNIILIPGTSSIEHLEQNVRALDIHLSDDDLSRLESLSVA
jgi:aryl-alcohol dehydrogenase-like predicted oxidoreductase